MADILAGVAEKLQPIFDDFERCDDSEIVALEKSIGSRLPANYAVFLKRFGRSMFAVQAIVQCPQLSPFMLFTMYGCKGNEGNILKDRENHPEYVARGYVPIADDNFGNRFVLDAKTGEIWFIDYSHESGSVKKVARSFEDFLENLKVQPWD